MFNHPLNPPIPTQWVWTVQESNRNWCSVTSDSRGDKLVDCGFSELL